MYLSKFIKRIKQKKVNFNVIFIFHVRKNYNNTKGEQSASKICISTQAPFENNYHSIQKKKKIKIE